jgi:hypothetical protein
MVVIVGIKLLLLVLNFQGSEGSKAGMKIKSFSLSIWIMRPHIGLG